ncbi:glycosyltransferase [Alphaproteobacteria bacterium]|nr:glycosyltransferase [Alphaproteobacteria bacterium]
MIDDKIFVCLPNFSGGGAEKVIMSLIKAWSPDYQVTCVALSDRGPLYAQLPLNCEFLNVNCSSARHSILPLLRVFRDRKPDVVVTTMAYFNFIIMFALLLSGHRPRQVILREANTPASTMNALKFRWLGVCLYKFLYNKASAIICNSEQVQGELADAGVKRESIKIIPNPVDGDALSHLAKKKITLPEFGDAALPLFVSVGRLTKQKGMERLIKWLAVMRINANLIIIGSGEQRENLLSIIRRERLEQRVKLIDFQDNPFPYMAVANAVVLGSHWEGLPNVGLEALALGKTVIVTGECGGLVDLKLRHSIDDLIVAKTGDQFISEMERISKNHVSSKAHLAHEFKTFKSSLPPEFDAKTVINRYTKIIFGA